MNTNLLAKRASSLHLAAISLAENLRNGAFKSLYRGQGIEFSDVREYQPFDNVRAIDWNVTARMGRAFIKQYEEEKELSVFFILDCSSSMKAHFSSKSKLSQAQETAMLLLLASEHNSSQVGAVFFDGKIQFSAEPKAGKSKAMTIFSRLDKIDSLPNEEKVNGSALPNAIIGAEKLLKKRSLVFILSDFRVSGWEKPVARLAQKNDVVALKITSPEDEKIPEIGTVPFFDNESKKNSLFPTNSKGFQNEWQEAEINRREAFKDFCTKHGGYPVILSTEDDSVQVLSRFFKSKF